MFQEQNIAVSGSVAPGFERVKQVFEKHFQSGDEVSAQLCVVHKGDIVRRHLDLTLIFKTFSHLACLQRSISTCGQVVDLWGSVADPEYDGDTLQTVWSSTKNLTALAVAMLVDRGLLAYTDLVTKHWPEYDRGQEGKDKVSRNI